VGLPGVGIDRLSMSFPVAEHAPPGAWDSHTYRYESGQHAYSKRVPVSDGDGPAVMVGVTTINGRPWGKAECNPARFADPYGCELLDPRMLPAAVTVMWLAVGELVRPAESLEQARVTRLDVARDFRAVTSPALYVEGLGPLRRPWARRSFTYNDPGRGDAQTLFVGSGAGGVRLYDQHQAYADKGAPEGSLRWEAEVRKGWLQRAGIRHVTDLDPVAVDRLALDRWKWSAMGTEVTGPVNAVQVVQRAMVEGRVTRAVGAKLLGELMLESFGFGRQAGRSERRHRDVMDELGVTAPALWNNDLSRQAVGRLDFEEGTEVLSMVGARSPSSSGELSALPR